ncbi:MAG: RluA family pseudouridine synthase [Candidatus Omnitrophica bacterium]|nr:RluA family pseudouridine synthase [Candidatus Omnitrophota bacterium]
MQEFRLKVSEPDQGLRLDQYIIRNLSYPISRSRIQQLIKAKNILVNQKSVKTHYKIRTGDLVLINIPEPEKPAVAPEQIPLEIVYEDQDLLIINKPSGMVTHPAVGNYSGTLVHALLGYGCALSTINGPLRPGIVHRLDKDTSGLIVVAKNDFAHQKLAEQFQKHTVKRKYLAVVKGSPRHNEGIIDYPLARHPQRRQRIWVSFHNSKQALTRYRVLQRSADMSLVELMPHTGRTHQLRVHLKFLGHPILGDARYGSISSFKRLALHATELGFLHPRSEKFVQFKSELPQCFQRLIQKLK